jgi:N-formylmaleamate deformylase
VVTRADVSELETMNPRASVVSVGSSGHMIPWDNLDEMVAAIEAFVSKLDGGRR